MAVEILLILLSLSALTIGVVRLVAYLFPRTSKASQPARATSGKRSFDSQRKKRRRY